jgi:uncharacterized protein (TIGR03435 family)
MSIRRTLLFTALAASALAASATEAAPIAPPAFDVISVKPDKGGLPGTRMQFTDDGFIVNNAAAHMLLMEGYNLTQERVIGEPGWVQSDKFDMEAKVAGPDVATLGKLTFDQRRSMFQQVLTDRFKLVAHHETRELPVYVLSIGKGGPKFKEAPPDPGHEKGAGRFMVSRGKISALGTAMPFLLTILSRQLGRTIIDKTGLTGNYDITLQWTPDDGSTPDTRSTNADLPTAPPPADSDPSIFTAIQEQLGLKLVSAKGPVDVLVIDHIEKPSEN